MVGRIGSLPLKTIRFGDILPGPSHDHRTSRGIALATARLLAQCDDYRSVITAAANRAQ